MNDYGIHCWGNGFFGITQTGEVCARFPGAPDLPLPRIVAELARQGMETPVLVRFPHILKARITELNESFLSAMKEHCYGASYRGVFPIKVNQQQQVLEEIPEFGRAYHYGLEVGSKPELIAALAYHPGGDALLVCNGYKDQEFIDLALRASAIGIRTVLVAEMPQELHAILDRAEALGIEPMIGIRVKLSSENSGHWADSSGDQSPFGLNSVQLLHAVDTLRAVGKLGCLKMLHCHQGSQVPDLASVRAATSEAARVYVGLVAEGAAMGLLNLGGGLAVDYDGTSSESQASAGYTIAGYANEIVSCVAETLAETNTPHPSLVTESGRAVTAHYSVLIVDTLRESPAAERNNIPSEPPSDARDHIEALKACSNDVTDQDIALALRTVRKNYQTAFTKGELSLRGRAAAESTYLKLGSGATQPEGAQDDSSALASRYYANFSIFQSLADSWAIDQIFPIMPIHRLDTEPTVEAVVNDITCDCDGKLRRYVTAEGSTNTTLPLHPLIPGESYYLGIFLVGAYQETLSDLHNLFGNTHAVSISPAPDTERGFQISHDVRGDTVADVLGYVEHDPADLVRRFRKHAEAALASGKLPLDLYHATLEDYDQGMSAYTYLES